MEIAAGLSSSYCSAAADSVGTTDVVADADAVTEAMTAAANPLTTST